MNCIIKLKDDRDKPYWVNRKKFCKYVDPNNLALRDSKKVEKCYHSGWFIKRENKPWYFEPARFYFDNRRILFLNGRHRTILLSRYLDVLPMAKIWGTYPTCQNIWNEVKEREIELEEEFQLPDLLIRDFDLTLIADCQL